MAAKKAHSHHGEKPAATINLPSFATLELGKALSDFIEWAEEHRRNAKALGERPCIDAHRVSKAKAALKRAGL